MIDEDWGDPLVEIKGLVSRIDAERARYSKMTSIAQVPAVGLNSASAERLLIGFLRFSGVPAPEAIACDLLKQFQSLTELFDAPLPLLRQAGLTDPRALSGIIQYRLFRDAIAIERFERDKASITPKALSEFLLKGRRLSNTQIRILFVDKSSKLLCDLSRDYSQRMEQKIIREICQIALYKDAYGLILAKYTEESALQFDDQFFKFDCALKQTISMVDTVVHDTVMVGPASIHSLSSFL